MIRPIVWLRCPLKARASSLRRYCNCSIALCTRRDVSSETGTVPLKTRETVIVPTPARRATSLIVGFWCTRLTPSDGLRVLLIHRRSFAGGHGRHAERFSFRFMLQTGSSIHRTTLRLLQGIASSDLLRVRFADAPGSTSKAISRPRHCSSALAGKAHGHVLTKACRPRICLDIAFVKTNNSVNE
jgi:hypothetical protein